VNHTAQFDAGSVQSGKQALDFVSPGHVGSFYANGGTGLRHPLDVGCGGGRRLFAADQDQFACAVLGEPQSGPPAESAQPTGDEPGSRG
jgi:hypothetical protein